MKYGLLILRRAQKELANLTKPNMSVCVTRLLH